MTRARWRDAQTPQPPTTLAVAVEARLERDDPGITPDAYLEAAERLLGALLREGCVSRESALDLLVADALVTYAFEAASDEPSRVIALAHKAMVRIASFAVAPARP